ncbi:MAG: bifunctional 3-demethylubiquinone-9 3-methyltransferase/ 2-octaprenyl-6-hydroxy phenol methylase [Syntrophorhabdaceae bacterium PtaU1.Bin034]|jgi:SAM-dependent methyltransferase|nr:MAG: bifunctional 3-demethylubiquinone-9 3-methyltransferase/ 2-octaprenyl-6-hydroxy phenol methylase [Syntrophorhabdaceae bacterium PtaU1.Bin034]
MKCPVCNSNKTRFATTLPFRLPSDDINTDVWKCMDCGCYWRDIPGTIALKPHFEMAAYTDPEKEERWRRERSVFFEHITRLALSAYRENGKRTRVLDVGCSYGHLLEKFDKAGCECDGIEPANRIRRKLNREGRFRVFENIEDCLKRKETYDIVTVIDTLYYSPDPPAYLRQLKQAMTDRSIAVIRVTNRTPLLNFYLKWNSTGITNDIFGDQLFAFSHRSMKTMLGACDLHLISVKGFERKPCDVSTGGAKYFLYYRIMPLIAAITGLKVTPGLIYLCRKKDLSSRSLLPPGKVIPMSRPLCGTA